VAAIPGVDYSSGRPDVACLVRGGKRFAIRYTSIGSHPKNMTLAETKALTAAGMRVVTVFEESAGRMLQGAAAGENDARVSMVMAEKAGAHKRAPHFFALDVDTHSFTPVQWAACAAYLDAAAKVLGKARVGLYADVRGINKLRSHVTWLWQTYAWSRDDAGVVQWATGVHLQQHKNRVQLCGAEVDHDRALKPLYGQWGVHTYDGVDLRRTQTFARTCDPIPYKMTVAVSRSGIDCSGFMSVLLRSLMGEANVWVRMFATGNIRDLFNAGRLPMLVAGKGDASDFNIGVTFPWEMTSGVGHTAGTLPGIGGVESRGGKGVLLGSLARRHDNPMFRHHYHMRGDAPTAVTPTPTYPPFPGRILRLGMSSPRNGDVWKYQSQMHHRGWDIVIDGDFGPKTRDMTIAFQRDKNLSPVDGEVGPITWKCAFTCPITR
jgi:Domain of unknown function (DUF1906)/Putative peptidoglycan binding domain